MEINLGTLRGAYINFNTCYQQGFATITPQWRRVATEISSDTEENSYPWLGLTTQFREWLGDRAIQGLAAHDYVVKNRDFENTVGIDRNKFMDDKIGLFKPIFEMLGQNAALHPDKLTFGLLKQGLTAPCYDGLPFFAPNHPTTTSAGAPTTIGNVDSGGTGPYWFLLSTKRAIKPLVFQVRMPYKFVALVNETDPNVFFRKQYVYGVECRVNAGFGPWQMAYASNQPLDSAHYQNARTYFGSLYGENGEPLDMEADLLVYPPTLEGSALTLLEATMVGVSTGGSATNIWKGTAERLKTSWVA